MKLMVFDVGGTEIKHAILDDNFTMTDYGYVPTPMDTFEHFANVINDIYQPCKDQVDGIAMSLPGFVDSEKGRVNGGGVLKYNWMTDVGPLLEEKCGCKVIIENDGKAAAQAEYYCGSLKGCTNAAVYIIGTGVGGGLILNGKIYRGRDATAGEYSFMIIDPFNTSSPNDFVGRNCSTTGLLDIYKTLKNTDEEIDGREFFRRYPDDECAKQALDDFAGRVARQVFNLYWLLDIEKIAIGGGISKQPVVVEKIREKFDELLESHPFLKHVAKPNVHIEIVQAVHGNNANLIGAYMTYKEHM